MGGKNRKRVPIEKGKGKASHKLNQTSSNHQGKSSRFEVLSMENEEEPVHVIIENGKENNVDGAGTSRDLL